MFLDEILKLTKLTDNNLFISFLKQVKHKIQNIKLNLLFNLKYF